MFSKKRLTKTFIILAVVLLMILPLVVSTGYILWVATPKDSGAYRFFSGVFGGRYDGPSDPVYIYGQQYKSAKPLSENIKSPVYILGSDIMEDIPLSDFATKLPSFATKQLYIPSSMRYYGMGLFVYSKDSDGAYTLKKTTSNNGLNAFDPTKPTIAFIHGMQFQNGATGDEDCAYTIPAVKAGYNILIFRWSQLTDDHSPMGVEPKIWGIDNEEVTMRWKDTNNKYVYDDIPNASVAEIFGAYYLDFISRFDFTGSYIQISGHSMGGQLAFAASSFLLCKEQEGLIPAAYLPDKVTIFDPYLTPLSSDVSCAWLGRNISTPVIDEYGNPVYTKGMQRFTSVIDTMADIAQALTDRGIVCEYVPSITGYVFGLMFALDQNEPSALRLIQNTVLVKYRTDWVTSITDFNGFHGAGKDWYFLAAMLEGYLLDNAMNNSTDLAPTPSTPLSYLFARRGTTYEMQENQTLTPTDDVMFSTNVVCAQIAGFAFYDANGNNSYDERVQARMSGVRVELYLKVRTEDKLVATTITDQAGFYSFDIPRINANGFDDFFIRVVPPIGYKVCNRGSSMPMMDNDINPNSNKSDTITLKHYKNLRILNIGLAKE